MTMTHIILTRFNVPTKGREAEIRSRTGWLERRFDIFEQYCLPAVAAQTNRDFTWVIYFDVATPAPFRDRIARCQKEFPFVDLYREDMPLDTVVDDVRALLKPGSETVLTTRLDNDDAIARDFVDRLQTAAHAVQPGTALNFSDGVSWRDGWVFSARDESNGADRTRGPSRTGRSGRGPMPCCMRPLPCTRSRTGSAGCRSSMGRM